MGVLTYKYFQFATLLCCALLWQQIPDCFKKMEGKEVNNVPLG